MKRIAIWTLLITGALALGTALLSSDVRAQATNGQKLGFIDIKQIVLNAAVFKNEGDKIRQAREEAQKKVDEMGRKLRDEQTSLESKKDMIQLDEYNKQKTELEKQFVNIRAFKRDEENKIDTMIRGTMEPLFSQLNDIVEAVAKEEGYAFVFKKQNLAYGAAQFNITDKIIERLNKEEKEQ